MTEKSDRQIDITILKGSRISETIDIPESLQLVTYPGNMSKNRNYGCMRVMTVADGDKRIVWDSNDLNQINDAKATFDKLVKEGLEPYKVGLDGKASSEKMEEFDPYVEEIIFLPIKAVVGG